MAEPAKGVDTAQAVDKSKPGWYATEYSEQWSNYVMRVTDFYYHYKDLMAFPPPDKEATWTVYLVTYSMFGHYMLAFVNKDPDANNFHCFIIHLTIAEDEVPVKNQFKIWLTINLSSPFEYTINWKELKLGDIKKSFNEIFITAFNVMVEFGPYTIFANNCQKYAKILAEKLGVPNTQVKTGSGAVMSGFSKISQIAREVLKIPVYLTDIPQEKPSSSKLFSKM